MRTLLPLLLTLLLSLAVQSDAQKGKSPSSSSAEMSTRKVHALTVPMRRRPQLHRRPPQSSRKSSTPASRVVLARRGPTPPATPSNSASAESPNRAAPGIVPPKGIAKQLNQAKFHEFMSLARSLMKSRALA